MPIANPKDIRCVHCGGATTPGTMRDSYGDLGSTSRPQTWLPPMPADSLAERMVAKTISQANEVTVVALRCVDCGHLDLFAP